METQNSPLEGRLPPGRQLKVIENGNAVPYLQRLNARLGQLSTIFEREETDYILPFMNVLRRTVELLQLKHQLIGNNKIDFDLTLFSNDSGFPSERDLFSLQKNKDEADAILGSTLSRDEIIDRIRKAILNGVSVEAYQNMLRRYNFFNGLANTDMLFKGYHYETPKFVKAEGKRRFYNVDWFCLERATRLPVFYRMCLEQDRNATPLEDCPNPRLETVVYQTQMGFHNSGTFARTIDNEVDEVHPKLIEKYTIGPFYDTITDNSPEMRRLIDSDNSILKFSITGVLSERVTQYGNWIDYLIRRKTERESFSPVFTETKMIVPFKLKQSLGNRDETDHQCKVYGITKGGDIVG